MPDIFKECDIETLAQFAAYMNATYVVKEADKNRNMVRVLSTILYRGVEPTGDMTRAELIEELEDHATRVTWDWLEAKFAEMRPN